ncbi:ParA family protein [uncultured Clostridium sp.]|uniref:ParA family protein n=1 Tax=uncultured Clostridium sp. TaxID=59620 RepID=UPI002622D14A|nr:ParA family protein [uncultured Clostridium sp.]
MRTKVIAVINQKGGEGKTTTVRNLSYILAVKGKKVLTIDMDSQGNLTTNCDLLKRELETIVDVFKGEKEINEVIINVQKNLDHIPNNIKMSKFGLYHDKSAGWSELLKEAIEPIKSNYDYIFIDCPPALEFATYNALEAADDIIITLQAEENSIEGIADLLDSVNEIREATNENLNIMGIVVTKFKKATKLQNQFHDMLKTHFGDAVFNTIIRDNIKIAEANYNHKSVVELDKNSNGAKDYLALAKEVLKRV